MFKDGLLKGRRILVTGGGTGLGKGMAEKFLQLGAELFICGRRKTVCEATAAELTAKHGGKVGVYGVDIRDAAAVDAMVADIFAPGPLTDLVNNAAGNFISRTEDLSPRGFDAVANIVMHGTFYVTQAVGRRWIAGGHRGNIVSIVVTWVYNGSPYVVPSVMSKSAVHAMTMSLATEWAGHGIRLNAIAPGVIPTDGAAKRLSPGEGPSDRTIRSNPMGRVGTMEELQNLATFLIAPGCDWLTGETITLDGSQSHATGSNFDQLRQWSDAQWQRRAPQSRRRTKRTRRSAACSDRSKQQIMLWFIHLVCHPNPASAKVGGRGGILKPTREQSPLPVFKTGASNHSATLPALKHKHKSVAGMRTRRQPVRRWTQVGQISFHARPPLVKAPMISAA